MIVISKYCKSKGKSYLSQQGKITQTFLIQDNSIKNKIGRASCRERVSSPV